MKNKKTIIAIAIVKNEEDIIECFCRYTLGFCDKLLIVEDNSDDETPKILDCLIEEGLPIIVFTNDITSCLHKRTSINDLAEIAFRQFKADLVIPLDADEFVTTDSNDTVRLILEDLSCDMIYQIHMRTYIFSEDAMQRKGTVLDRFIIHRPIKLETKLKSLISYTLFVEDGYRIDIVSYDTYPSEYSPDRRRLFFDKLLCAHFPFRSIEQINTKIILAYLNYKYMPKQGVIAKHWINIYETIKRHGGLSMQQAEIESVFYSYSGDMTEITDTNYHESLISKPFSLKPVFPDYVIYSKYTPLPKEYDIDLGIILSLIEKMIEGFASEKNETLYEKNKILNDFALEINETKSYYEKEIQRTTKEILSSNSWKTGRLLTSPVRIVKRILHGNRDRKEALEHFNIQNNLAEMIWHKFDSCADYIAFTDSPHAHTQKNNEEQINNEVLKNKEPKVINAFCIVCNKKQNIRIGLHLPSADKISYRETCVCEGCRLNNRQRLMMALVEKIHQNDSGPIYIQEQVTRFYNLLLDRFSNVIGSEYLGEDKEPGEYVDGIRHEDCMNLSFKNESISLIISKDVYEHIPDALLAFKEAYRVLEPGGKMVFSIPFFIQIPTSTKRAAIEYDELVYYMEPKYHGNPVSPLGSLVYYDYGQDIFNMLLKAGFQKTEIICSDDYSYGHYGRPYLFLSHKY